MRVTGHHAFRRADNGSEFGAHRKNGKKEWDSRFKRHLESLCIKLITSRIKHPQTNGKIEKLFDCYNSYRDDFDGLQVAGRGKVRCCIQAF